MKICIDAGHGGKDPGAVSEGTQEKDINLQIAKKLYEILEKNNYQLLMTRLEDNYISLEERTNMANDFDADIFISIHNNAVFNPDVQGTETLYYPGSEKGERLAKLVQDELVKKLQRPDRGIKPRGKLAVLKYTVMPAILVECAFLTNPTERKLLQDSEFQELIAEATTEGIGHYFEEV